MQSKALYKIYELSKIFDESQSQKTAFLDYKKQTTISYGELLSQVQSQSSGIQLQLKQKRHKILLFLDSDVSFVVSFFAVLLSGNTPVLINNKLKNELKNLNKITNIILTDNGNLKHLESYLSIKDYEIILTQCDTEYRKESQALLDFSPNKEMLYLFTSGSTGKPKLVMKSLENIMIELQYLETLLAINEKDVILPLVPGFHIYGLLFTVLLPLMVGASIRTDIPFSPMQVIEDGILTGSNFVVANPSLFSAMGQVISAFEQRDFSHVKAFISSTMPLDEDLAHQFYKKYKIPILELYGSTETGGIAYRKQFQNKYWSLFPYVQSKINEDDQVLLLKSPSIPDSATKKDWFNTGDIVELHSGNQFELLGRTNQIVKVGGNRVSAIEVEKVIRDSKLIEDVVVIGSISKGLEGEKLIAYIKAFNKDDTKLTSKLKAYCRQNLAGFKIPKTFIIVDSIPKGANKKILYHKLAPEMPE